MFLRVHVEGRYEQCGDTNRELMDIFSVVSLFFILIALGSWKSYFFPSRPLLEAKLLLVWGWRSCARACSWCISSSQNGQRWMSGKTLPKSVPISFFQWAASYSHRAPSRFLVSVCETIYQNAAISSPSAQSSVGRWARRAASEAHTSADAQGW